MWEKFIIVGKIEGTSINIVQMRNSYVTLQLRRDKCITELKHCSASVTLSLRHMW